MNEKRDLEINEYLKMVFEIDIQDKKLKNSYKRQLKGLINISGLFKFLQDNIDWVPEEIVDIELTNDKSFGYGSYQHARIVGDESRRLYLKNNCDEIRKVNHYYVWQISGSCEDDYSGFMLFPLKNGKYFKVSYSC
jgi:hypothetical protein